MVSGLDVELIRAIHNSMLRDCKGRYIITRRSLLRENTATNREVEMLRRSRIVIPESLVHL